MKSRCADHDRLDFRLAAPCGALGFRYGQIGMEHFSIDGLATFRAKAQRAIYVRGRSASFVPIRSKLGLMAAEDLDPARLAAAGRIEEIKRVGSLDPFDSPYIESVTMAA